jgi:phosphonate transport system ATP-binding protein
MTRGAVHCRGLSVRTSDRAILSDINLAASNGERIAIIGHNGAGKTTLIKVLMGTMSPTAGNVSVCGVEITPNLSSRDQMLLRRKIGFIPQGAPLLNRLTVLQNVLVGTLGRNQTLGTLFFRVPAKEKLLAMSLLHEVGVDHLAEKRAADLSGGERQKVAIAKALAQEPELLIADEPTSALDPQATLELMETMNTQSKKRNMTALYIIHNLDLVGKFADRVIGLSQGQLLFSKPASELCHIDCENIYGGSDGVA